jgi:hypothetical protein
VFRGLSMDVDVKAGEKVGAGNSIVFEQIGGA